MSFRFWGFQFSAGGFWVSKIMKNVNPSTPSASNHGKHAPFSNPHTTNHEKRACYSFHCKRKADLLSRFRFVSNIPRTLFRTQAHPTILSPRFGFVVEFWVCFERSTHTVMLYAHITIFFPSFGFELVRL